MLALQIEKMRIPYSKGSNYQFDITPVDLCNMCGIPKEEQPQIIQTFETNSRIKLISNKIFVKDVEDLISFSIYCRNHSVKKAV